MGRTKIIHSGAEKNNNCKHQSSSAEEDSGRALRARIAESERRGKMQNAKLDDNWNFNPFWMTRTDPTVRESPGPC